MSNEEKQMLDRVLAEHRYDPSSVIAVMQAVQKTYRYLPQEMLSYIAEKLGISEAKIYRREDTSLRFVTERHVMYVNPFRSWRNSAKN